MAATAIPAHAPARTAKAAGNKAAPKASGPEPARPLRAPQAYGSHLSLHPSSIPVHPSANDSLVVAHSSHSDPLLHLQRNLAIGSTTDPLEAEADHVADQVMSMGAPSPQLSAPGSPPALRRKCACEGSGSECSECREKKEEKLQLKAQSSAVPTEAPPIVHQVLRSPGQQLDPATRAYFEPRFGADFSGVRVHTDDRAADSARGVNALAYTVGSHIVFASGKYAPNSVGGKRLVAHELAHVCQQNGLGRAASSGIALQRQGDPQSEKQSPGDQGKKEDEPTPWLTLQAQPFIQYQRIFTMPSPPPWLLGGQLAANVQFHSGDTGFELGVLGQYGHIFTWNSKATAGGDQFQVALQPSYVLLSAKLFGDRTTQLALIAQGAYASTSSTDPSVAGQQISLIGGAQLTQDIAQLGPLKLQGVASAGGGVAWNKGPTDTGYSAAGDAQVQIGIQIAWDAVKRKRTPPSSQHVEVPIAPQNPEKEKKQQADDNKRQEDQRKAQEEARKKAEDQQKKPTPPPPPPLPKDLKIYFLRDKPLNGLPSDANVIDSGVGGDDLAAAKAAVQAAFAADPAIKVSISGYASIEAPSKKYNCDLGSRRAEWIRRQLGIPMDRVTDLTDKAPEICEDKAGLVSFGSNKASDTTDEAERRHDRYAVVHFQK